MTCFSVPPETVRETLAEHILTDGFHLTIDLDRSHGSWMYDAGADREILDFYSYFATLPIGHNHPEMVRDERFMAALTRAALANPANSDIYTPEYAAFVQAFGRFAKPNHMRYLFFVAGGALAVENALKVAFDWKVQKNRAAGRGDLGDKVIHFKESFHGRSGYTLSLTNTDPAKTDAFPKFDWPRISNPKLSFPITPEIEASVAEAEARAVAEIEAAFADHPHDIAAIIIEPIQCEGGDNHFRPEFLQQLRRLADRHEALLVFDEVQTGFGLTGTFWCYEQFGVQPDIVAFGKKSQVCGIMAGPRVDDVEKNVFHVSSRINSTWGGNLVDMVRCAKYLEIIAEHNLVDNAARVGNHLLAGLKELSLHHRGVTNVRGRGLLSAFTLPTPDVRNQVRQTCWDLGLATLASWPQSLRFRPCLTLSHDEADRGLEILETALTRHGV